jgi:20S proteasome alpha/beta subunit
LSDKVYILRSGSAADTQAIAGFVQLYIAQHQAEANEPIRVKTAAHMAMQLAYQNKDALQVCAVKREAPVLLAAYSELPIAMCCCRRA